MNNSDLRAVVCVEVATVRISRAPVWDYTISALLTGCCVPANRDYARDWFNGTTHARRHRTF